MDEIGRELVELAAAGRREARVPAAALIVSRGGRRRRRTRTARGVVAAVAAAVVVTVVGVTADGAPPPVADLAASPPSVLPDPPVPPSASATPSVAPPAPTGAPTPSSGDRPAASDPAAGGDPAGGEDPADDPAAGPAPGGSPGPRPGAPAGSAPPAPPALVTVEQRVRERADTDEHVRPHLRLVNRGAEPLALDGLTLRYHFTPDDPAPLVAHCDYAAVGCTRIATRFGPSYLEVGFPGAGPLAPGAGTGDIELRVNHADWSPFDEGDDHSYAPTTAWAPAPRVTVHRDGALVAGDAP